MYSLDKFYVSHFSKKIHLKNILESYALQPLELRRKLFKENYPNETWFDPQFYESAESEGNIAKYDKSIFYSIIFPDNDGNPIFKPRETSDEIYFIFSPKIIEDNAKMKDIDLPIFCSGWYYGNTPDDKCIVYDTTKSLVENLNTFRDMKQWAIDYYHSHGKLYLENIMPFQSRTLRSELLMEGEMPIELDLVHIYVPKYKPVTYSQKMIAMFPELRDANKDEEELETELQMLMDKNHHLPWIRTNPFI